VQEEVRLERQSGVRVDAMVVDIARGPMNVAAAYKSMYAFGNHFRVLSSETPLKTCDSGVAATFRQVCRNGIRDANQTNADVEYVGHIEEILELNYRRHCLVVLVCDFVKANYVGENATIKKDKWGFTLANYDRRFGRICRDSFTFPRHCEQVFYSNARESPGWRVVLRKEVRGRRVVPNNESETEPELFQMGQDEDFEGLRPDREVGEQAVEAATTGENVILEPVFRPNRATRGGRGVRGRGQGGRRGGRAAANSEPFEEENFIMSIDEDEPQEEEPVDTGETDNTFGGRGGSRSLSNDGGNRNIRRRHLSWPDEQRHDDTTSEEDTSPVDSSSNESSQSSSDSSDDG
jgi:hypothetical protein